MNQNSQHPLDRPGAKIEIPVRDLTVSACTVPTDSPEADGTLTWEKTTIVIVEVKAGDKQGMGFTYAGTPVAVFIRDILADLVRGQDAMAIPGIWDAMLRKVRNHGLPGVAAMAVSAVDVALWDLKARLLELPLVSLLGAVRDGIPVYGSGGFTSYTVKQLQEQLDGWTEKGISRVKMKIGTHPGQDMDRVRAAREAIGPDNDLFVDANGAYTRKQALMFAEAFAGLGVKWFEEPVSSNDLQGLRLLRDRAPAVMDITAGEYGYDLWYFQRMLEAQAVDVLMVDGSRCGGITGFMKAAALVEAYQLPLSAHTAPSIHAHVCCAASPAVHVEYFHDHVRIEQIFFEGTLMPENGILYPDRTRTGLGLELKHADVERYLDL